jgi:hypothetical protein
MTQRFDPHLEPHEIANYVHGDVGREARASIDAHLADCAECRMEVADVSGIVHTAPRTRTVSRRIWIPVAAAAALAVLWVGPRALRQEGTSEHRAEPVTATVAPRAIAPVGPVDAASVFVWSSVPDANSYRVRLFDADGSVLWEREATDTVVAAPNSITLRPPLVYYWRVEAHTGFDRQTESDLVEFRLQERRP